MARQGDDGYWLGELEGDSILESEYLLLLAFLGREGTDVARRCAASLVEQQLPAGGWGQYPGAGIDVSASVKAYFALKLTGRLPHEEPLVRARRAILAAGGVERVNSFTRFYLALLGQLDYKHCPAVPPEMILLPTWSPIHIYRISAWSRTIFVPLSIVSALQPVRPVTEEQGIRELFLSDPRDWPPLSCPGRTASRRWWSWENFFRRTDRTFKWLARQRITPLRRRALATAQAWMLERFADSDGLGAIFPPIVWSVIALQALGYADDSPEVAYQLRELDKLTLHDDDTSWLQPCRSPVWDTAIALRALAATGRRADDPRIARGIDWLLAQEIRRPGDWAQTTSAEPGGWCFEFRNVFYPDVDDTAMVVMALGETLGARSADAHVLDLGRTTDLAAARQRSDLALRAHDAAARGTAWMRAMQNRDGGWGAFDRDNDAEFLCQVPFADHNAMIDPSTPDLAARALEALLGQGIPADDPAVVRTIAYLRRTQQADGSWFGRWGVNYIYGTWQVLTGLAAAGVPRDDSAVVRGANWLVAQQQPTGGWGESPDSYADPRLKGHGEPTPSQTAWAVLGLVATGRADHPAATRGVEWLLAQQTADGDWPEEPWTGTGFPLVFYLRYHLYRVYFPLLALARYRAALNS